MDRAHENTADNKLFEGTLDAKNPYNAPEGEQVYRILITHNNHKNPHRIGEAQDYKAAVIIPVAEAEYHPNELEGAATLAYVWAKEHHGLNAGMMAACAFYYYDEEAQGWVYFL